MPTYTTSTDPIVTDFAIKLFDSGLALYTGNFKTVNSTGLPFEIGDSLGTIPGSGVTEPFYVFPVPEMSSTGTPNFTDYRVSAYSRWTDEKSYSTKIVAGTVLAVCYVKSIITGEGAPDPPELSPFARMRYRLLPIFHTQTTVKQVISASETLNISFPANKFYDSDMKNFKQTIPQWSVGNQNFENQDAAQEYASENNGTVVDTSFISQAKKFSQFFPGELSPSFYDGNFDVRVEPTIKEQIIQFNQNNFGNYVESDYTTSPEQNFMDASNDGELFTATINILYNFGVFQEIIS